ncbi:esterase family protein [Pseudooceanicola sp. CBS1P-1]|uniref:Esterase family protein n=1 Tax=Pseudooceanicola albus TaxID=2692189 RepID=A0A6L7G6Q1_9RHOB|nr:MULTISPECIES: alpha/beta hydrolase-fold protein [Pseudooceanicola]MBT9383029.1 esterase family protein [Pseudooceanicola endophyticus]MXN19217.1 hypothetical protein [Pseudooceanicola albus]
MLLNRPFRLVLMMVMAALVLGPGAAVAEVRTGLTLSSRTLGHRVAYDIYLPPGYDSDSRDYPVLYLLHGGGTGQPDDWFTLAGIDQLLDRMIGAGEIRPMIVVAPDGRRNVRNDVATYFLDDADGTSRWETMFFQDFVPAIEARYRAIGTGDTRALMGISMGGLAAVVYQLHHPDAVAGVAAYSAAFRTQAQLLGLSPEAYQLRYGGLLGPGLEGKDRVNDAWRALTPEALIAGTDRARFARVPRLWLMTGAEDPFFEGEAQLHVALRAAGIRDRFLVADGGHNWPFWRAHLAEGLRHINAVLTRDYGE